MAVPSLLAPDPAEAPPATRPIPELAGRLLLLPDTPLIISSVINMTRSMITAKFMATSVSDCQLQ
jgi:hypothetical protein